MNLAQKGAAVFLDRDGTVIREVNYLCAIEQIEILPGVSQALRLLRAHGFKLVMVTNQSVVARGRLSENGLQAIHAELKKRLSGDGAALDAIYYCPHHPTEGMGDYRIACDCRKPKPGMIERAVRELALNPALSYVVGDQLTDMELAIGVGASGILIGREQAAKGDVAAINVPVVADLSRAAEWIVERLRQSQIGAQ
ncbi:MAG: D-glycero-alpha-D-manno-heptose-1,7-bisphosphate 7-phosphatase [Candidatus Binatia bacterium]